PGRGGRRHAAAHRQPRRLRAHRRGPRPARRQRPRRGARGHHPPARGGRGRRRRAHRRVGVDGPGGRGRGPTPGLRGLPRRRRRDGRGRARRPLHALPARPPRRGGGGLGRRRAPERRDPAGPQPAPRLPGRAALPARGGLMALAKPQRQHRIAKLLAENAVTSQAHLVELLAAEGVQATQATVSRDLEDLGAIKVRVAGGETVYAIPELPTEQRAPEDHLRRVFGDWVVEVASSGNLVVLRTPPGSAHVVGSALDRAGIPEVLGTVAGDDTLIVVVAESTTGAEVAARLADLAGLST